MGPEHDDTVGTAVEDPDLGPKFIKLYVGGEEVARLTWRQAEAIADTVRDDREGGDE